MRIGILTGGGDAPGLNGIIEAATKTMIRSGHEVIGIKDGFEGVFEGRTLQLTEQLVTGSHGVAGTLLGTSNKCGTDGREKEFLKKYKDLRLDGLIAAGGDGTFKGLSKFNKEIPLIGVPKTIDNDLEGTDITFGYDTACSVVAHAVDSLRMTADSHKRVIIVETMGRTAGWIALGGGMASYADAILIPERPFKPIDLLSHIKIKRDNGQRGIIIVVSEGAHATGEQVHISHVVKDAPEKERLGGIAEHLARWIEREIKFESRHIVLGHLQRSTPPSTTDRFLTLAMGVKVGKMVDKGMWGMAAVYRDGMVAAAPITDFFAPPRVIEKEHRYISMCQSVGIFI
jgi:6-phosphofructokinase